MICPKCKNSEVKEQVSIKGFWIFRKKEVIYFCPLCDFENKKSFKISKEDKKIELEQRYTTNELQRINAINTKKKIEEIDRKSKYDESREYG